MIGYEGEIVQCIPLNEMAYAVIGENDHSISIECCYLDQDGKFTDATYQSLLKLLGWLMEEAFALAISLSVGVRGMTPVSV